MRGPGACPAKIFVQFDWTCTEPPSVPARAASCLTDGNAQQLNYYMPQSIALQFTDVTAGPGLNLGVSTTSVSALRPCHLPPCTIWRRCQ